MVKSKTRTEIKKVVTANMRETRGVDLYIKEERIKLNNAITKTTIEGINIPIEELNLWSPHGN